MRSDPEILAELERRGVSNRSERLVLLAILKKDLHTSSPPVFQHFPEETSIPDGKTHLHEGYV